MSTLSTTSTTPSVPTPAGAANALVEWVAGELARSPVAMKLAGLASVVVGAVPGLLTNVTVKAALIAGGSVLASIVHLADATTPPKA